MSAPILSIRNEIERLQPLGLPNDETEAPAHLPIQRHWEELTRNLQRLGKQQMRANQSVEFLESEILRVRDQSDEHRREAQRLREESIRTVERVLEIVDTVDDLLSLARQVNDPREISRLERLAVKVLRMLEQIGVSEISTADISYDPDQHDALDTAEAKPGQAPYTIVQVIRRGFRFKGSVLRRAEVITSR